MMFKKSLFFALFFTSSFAFSQATKQTILNNGPDANRINIILLSEGYRNSELDKFRVDAANTVNNLLAAQPYAEYRDYFNAYAISVASVQSGSDHPGWPQFRDTYFNSSYDNSMSSISILTIPASGQDKVNALLKTFAPKHDLVIIVVNDLVNGGSAQSTGSTVVVSIGAYAPQIVAHESAHSLAGLGDEYSTPNPNYSAIEEPNTTRQTDRSLIKWNAWINSNTPIPTPANLTTVIGLFEGAHYQTTGWYRPKADCLMRNLDAPFCEVCSEALVKSIYNKVRPIQSFTPASAALSIPSPQSVSFNVSTLQPSGHNLSIQWFTNGVPVQGATGPSFYLDASFLNKNVFTIKAQVTDKTSSVRSDPSSSLSQSVSWKLYISDSTIVWETSDGRLAEWFMNGTNLLGSTSLLNGKAVGKDWRIVGLNDFNGDGQTDFLWQKTDGHLAVWFMNGIKLVQSISIPKAASSDWRIVGLNDFDGNGQTDFLWQSSNGYLAVWFMNQGINFVSSTLINGGQSVGRDWRIVGLNDFNSDGQADFIWQNINGYLAVWFMDKTALLTASSLFNGYSLGPDWKIVGLKDLNKDGQTDLIWQSSNGYLATWFLNQTNFLNSSWLNNRQSVGTDWRIVGVK